MHVKNRVAGVLFVLAFGSALMAVCLQLRFRAELMQKRAAEQPRLERLTELSAANQRFSNVAAATELPQKLSDSEFSELLRLRSEVGMLRRATNDWAIVRKTNERLRAARDQKNLADSPTGPDFWRKDQLAYHGYSTPEAALKTVFWAISNLDTTTLLASFTPESKAKFVGKRGTETQASSDFSQETREMAELLLGSATGFRTLKQKPREDGTVLVSLYFAGEGATRGFVLKPLGNEWKIHDILFAGQLGSGQR